MGSKIVESSKQILVSRSGCQLRVICLICIAKKCPISSIENFVEM
jgi:hypothetical protein